MSAVLERNALEHDDVISIVFTATPDLVSEFPALAARELGMGDVPLMCATEIAVPHALPRVLRLMAHVETDAAARRDPARLPARRRGPAPGHRPVSDAIPSAVQVDPRRSLGHRQVQRRPGRRRAGSVRPTSTPARCTAPRPSPSSTPGWTPTTPRRGARGRRRPHASTVGTDGRHRARRGGRRRRRRAHPRGRGHPRRSPRSPPCRPCAASWSPSSASSRARPRRSSSRDATSAPSCCPTRRSRST